MKNELKKKKSGKKKQLTKSKKKRLAKKEQGIVSKPVMRARAFFVVGIMLVVMFLLVVRVAYIKVVHGETYEKTVANRMVKGDSDIKAQRGAIVDRNSKTLATSVIAYNVILSPYDVLTLTTEQRQSVYEQVASVPQINKSADEVKKLVEANPTSKYKVLAKNLVEEDAAPLKGVKGVSLDETYIRKYPKSTLAAQLIGFYNKNSEGQYGIEQQYESYLVGTPGRVFSQYQNAQIVTKEVQAAKPGATVKLTIDEIIQQYVETVMEKYIKQYEPINASATLMNPNTGEIYAMYSYPSFDPNTYNNLSEQLGESSWNALSGEEQYEKLTEAWLNRAVQYTYEPGSTFKPIFAAAMLDEGIINGTETYYCSGAKKVADRTIKCWDTSGHATLTLEDVLAHSCNVGMMEISAKTDSATILNYMKRYGFGQTTGVNLPGETTGMLHESLGPVEKATYSMGQGFTSTPLQLLNAFSAVVNGGYLMQPYVVSEVIDETNTLVYEQQSRVISQVISSDTSTMVRQYIRKTVEKGTGIKAAVTGYDIGGKTGTAQKIGRQEGDYVLSFVGFAPVNNPQVVALITFDQIEEGTGAPASAFKEIMENVLPYLEIETTQGVTAENLQTTKVPEVTNMDLYAAVNKLAASGLNYEVVGVGTQVEKQYPDLGVSVSKGSKVKIYTTTKELDNIVAVPDVMGMTIEEAHAVIGEQFILEGTGKGKISSQVPRGGTKIESGNKIIVKTTE